MIYAIDDKNRAAFRRQLESWQRLGVSSGKSTVHRLSDHTDGVVHLLKIDDYGCLLSGMRLAPRSSPFSSFDYDQDVCELNAFLLSEQLAVSVRHQAGRELLIALVEYGLASGMAYIHFVTELPDDHPAHEIAGTFMLPANRPLSDKVGRGIVLEISLDAADRLREEQDVHGPVLTYQTTPPPYSSNDNEWLRLI